MQKLNFNWQFQKVIQVYKGYCQYASKQQDTDIHNSVSIFIETNFW